MTFNCTPSAAGVFSLAANLTDSLGDSVNVTASLSVLPSLAIHATFSPATFPVVDVGVAVAGTALASNGLAPYAYSWSWGDGNGSTGADASHAYSVPGVYVAAAEVRDATDASAGFSVGVTVVARPTAEISLAPGNVTDVDFPVSFAASILGGTTPGNETWTFGDSTESTGLNVSHAWTRPGEFTVTFAYADALGVQANRSAEITVHPSLSASFRSGNVSSSSPAAPGSPVEFTSNISGGTPPYELTWSFGDGSNATGLTVSHSYASAGSYTVRATLTDAVGATVATDLSLAIAQNASSSGSISSPGGGFVPGVFLGLIVGGVLAAAVLFVAGRRRGAPPPAHPARPYVPP
jgi:PKD repeat protein